ncbi:calcium-binding protein [Azospirillum sp.]|uniref:beta strand repeat-containing protein n=1 Tax=Azospirillum sp. TaxID=34012 RepID=UPI002D546F60|nr:calcium-binding protein [Azospirillum sp.]HYD67955.1 calcium-binding protein [Azospirillum sp.]
MVGSIVVSTEEGVNTTVSNDQYSPSVAVLANGTRVVTWTSNGQDGAGFGIYARRYDATGAALGGEFRVNSVTGRNEVSPSVAALGNGGFMVVWHDYQTSLGADPIGVYAQRYDASGVAVGAQMTLSPVGCATPPKVVALADGSALALWQASNGTIAGQRFDANGQALTGVYAVSTYSGNGGANTPNATPLGDGRYLVTWCAWTNSIGMMSDVWGQVYAANHTPVGGAFMVNSRGPGTVAYGEQQNAAVGLADGGFVVVWMAADNRDGSGNGIFLRRYNAAGQQMTGEVLVNNAYVTGDQQQPCVTALADGGFMVAWTSAGQDGSGYGVYAQRYDATAQPLGGTFLLEANSSGHQLQPALTARPDGGLIAAWGGQDGAGYGVQLREFGNAAGGGSSPFIIIEGTAGNDALTGGGTRERIYGRDGMDTLSGGAGDDILFGGNGQDVLDGGTGADLMLGGAGDDIYLVDQAGDTAWEDAGDGVDEVRAATASYTLSANIERLTFVGTGAFAGTGNALDNTIRGGAADDVLSGNAGNDSLDGGAGADTLAGGTGNDVYVVDSPADVVVEAVGEGTDEVQTILPAYTLGANLERLVYTGSGAFAGTGNAGANYIQGGFGNDSLHGGGGADTLVGGAGNDIYIADAGSVVVEGAGGGIDEVWSTANAYALDIEVELLTFVGSGDFAGTGNALANIIRGGAGNDTLMGGAGADTLIGAAGNDVYSIGEAGDVVTEDASGGVDEVRTTLNAYSLGANLENLTFEGGGAFSGTGNALDNLLRGGAGNDTLVGGAGNDTLVGGVGTDRLSGGTGDDLYTIDTAGTIVVELDGAGIDEVRTTLASFRLSNAVERLTFVGTGAFNGAGNASDNTIIGGDGNDTITGAGGADRLEAGAGDDLMYVDGADTFIDGGDGFDTVYVQGAAGATVDLATARIERIFGGVGADRLSAAGATAGVYVNGGDGTDQLTGSAFADTLGGGDGDDTIGAGDGNDTITGGTGADQLVAGAGDDLMYVDGADTLIDGGDGFDTVYVQGIVGATVDLTASRIERVFGGAGDDRLSATTGGLAVYVNGGAGNDQLAGGSQGDTLAGGDGNDTVNGGDGSDTITGGAGADQLVAGAGDDLMYVDGDDTLVEGGDGFDTVYVQGTVGAIIDLAAAGIERIFGGVGSDRLSAAGAGAAIYVAGGDGDDQLTGTAYGDTLAGGNDNDTIEGGDGDDTITGGVGADRLVAGAGNDLMYVDGADTFIDGGDGFDTAYIQGIAGATVDLGAARIERVFGGAGDDRLSAQSVGSGLYVNGGDGDDQLTGGSGADTLVGGDGDDVVSAGDGDDTITGGAGADQLVAGAGDDLMYIDGADAHIDAGAGFDTVYVQGTVGATIDLAAAGIERIFGGVGGDRLSAAGAGNATYINGGDDSDQLSGGTGADTLVGGNGDDTLAGGGGDDTLTGGAGADVFKIFDPSHGRDHVTDFSAGTDKIAVVGPNFGSITTGMLSASNFALNAPGDANDWFVFNTSTGVLSFDADGSGTGAAVSIAVLNVRTLSASDIVVLAG